MLLGSFFKRVGLIDEAFSAKMNKFAFAVALPALLFHDISAVDIRESWNGGFVLFCFIATFLSITGVTVLSFFVVKREERGEFVQGAYRSSAAILGIAFIQNIYGTSGMAPLMIIGTVPLYNAFAVIVLSLLKPGQRKMDKGNCYESDYSWNCSRFCVGNFKNSTAGDSAKNSEKYGSACNSAWSYGDGSFFRGKKGTWKIKTDSHCKCFKISGACSHLFADCSLAWIS